jgi:DNA-binding CsgD family transcriptional regulator
MSESSGHGYLGFTPELYPPGTHACYMYNEEKERSGVVHPFVVAGLENDEDVHYLADTVATQLAARAIDDRSAATLTTKQLSRLSVAKALDVYCPSGTFKAQDMLDTLRRFYDESRANGSSGCRVAGETSWMSSDIPGSEQWLFYESSLNSLLTSAPMTLLCEYDTERVDGTKLFDILSVHPLMVMHGQIMRNPYYVTIEEQSVALEHPISPKKASPGDVLGQLLLIQIVLVGLPDEVRMAEFACSALMTIPGVREAFIVLPNSIIPPDDRWESVREHCAEAAKDPNIFNEIAILKETNGTTFLVRSVSQFFGVVIVELDDETAFAPYRDFLYNIANSVAMALDLWHGRSESRARNERIASLEQRLWRISQEIEGVGISPSSGNWSDPYSVPGVKELSQRQWAVLTRLVQGDRVAHIAEALFISQSAVRNHLSDIYRKLHVHSQEELLGLFRNPMHR